jgi:hypothetical protein
MGVAVVLFIGAGFVFAMRKAREQRRQEIDQFKEDIELYEMIAAEKQLMDSEAPDQSVLERQRTQQELRQIRHQKYLH